MKGCLDSLKLAGHKYIRFIKLINNLTYFHHSILSDSRNITEKNCFLPILNEFKKEKKGGDT
jgi:hypothetical protein